MNVIRTFHPVGQGAFYTELFVGRDGKQHAVVYDCGTETAKACMHVSLEQQIMQFKNSLGNHQYIDYLLISHFHADHINGLKWLLDNLTVGKIIIPMLTEEILTLTRTANFLNDKETDKSDTIELDSFIQSIYYDEKPPKGIEEIIGVLPFDEEGAGGQRNRGNTLLPRNGKRIASGSILSGIPFWEYVPFNSIETDDPRAIGFVHELTLIDGAMDGERLNVDGLVRGCRSKVRDAYRKAMKSADDNLYTLVVDSRPTVNTMVKPCRRLAHCIYFGDFDSKDNDELWNRLEGKIEYDKVGTVQVPHHGSKYNWRHEMGDGSPREYIVSTGSTNEHHHPDFWVLKEIWERWHKLFVVSEKWGTGKEYVFYI
jgi:beta-lactamase superfamily II metal-dependent hydrolase